MSGNSSATGGYIVGKAPGPPTADAVQAALQTMVASLSRLPGALVRPRWQPTPAVQPDAGVTWASIGAVMTEADEYPFIKHVASGLGAPNGYSVMQRHLTLSVVATFYGPGADDSAASLRDALYIGQNWEPLIPLGLKLRTIHDLARVPELINQQYIDRVDLRIEFRMQQDRVYPILNLAGAAVDLVSETVTAEVETDPTC